MKAECVAKIKSMRAKVIDGINTIDNEEAKTYMNEALAYLNGALNAIDDGMDSFAMVSLEESYYWLQKAQKVI